MTVKSGGLGDPLFWFPRFLFFGGQGWLVVARRWLIPCHRGVNCPPQKKLVCNPIENSVGAAPTEGLKEGLKGYKTVQKAVKSLQTGVKRVPER